MKHLREKLSRSFKRRLAKALLPMSVLPTKLVLRKKSPLRILVDSSVLAHGITHEGGWISTGSVMWGGKVEVPTGYLAKIPIHAPSNDTQLYNEVQYLAGIAHLARKGYLKLCTSAELKAEQFRQPIGRFQGYGYADHNVFAGIRFESIDGFKLDLSNPKQAQLDRIASCNDPVYQTLLAQFGQKQSLDAYHIYTAEKFGLFAFLHIDFKLDGSLRRKSKATPFEDLKTRVLLPSQFAKMINLLPVHTNLLTLGDDDTFFTTRADLHAQDQKRHRPKSQP
ncbi:hypothetical protein [Bradyrhizobium monzae]|uniref:hypothetical protein n=1 Tax=Bradyrhizobium sp. Oc8 TaxID=2876780 RepID=UPI001F3C45E7|nr:hypothetical protein [Bradyrhizobium sp. Oc8]